MDAETKKQAIAHVLEKTKDRNYRKHINADMMTIILRDVFTCMDEWEGPKRVSGEH
jgi:hypothetical protein